MRLNDKRNWRVVTDFVHLEESSCQQENYRMCSAHGCSGGFTFNALSLHQSSATSSEPSSLGIETVPASASATIICVSCSYFSHNEESPTWSCPNSAELRQHRQGEHHGEETVEMHICWGTKELSFVMAGVYCASFWWLLLVYDVYLFCFGAGREIFVSWLIYTPNFELNQAPCILASHPHTV